MAFQQSPQAPAAPPPATAGPASAPDVASATATGGEAASALPQAPIAREQADFLRARRTSLSNQLESAQDRRDEVAETIQEQGATPALTERLRVLDERLVQIEKDIAENGRLLSNAPPSTTSTVALPPIERFVNRANPNLMVIFGFALLMPFAVRLSRRLFGRGDSVRRYDASELAALKARLERMETAVDAVAVEVERVGEGQRFTSQLLAERAPALGAGAFEGVAPRAAAAEPAIARADRA
jgi:hypothetical protein